MTTDRQIASRAAAAHTANAILDEEMTTEEYSAFATYCDNYFGAGPTAMVEEDPEELLSALDKWRRQGTNVFANGECVALNMPLAKASAFAQQMRSEDRSASVTVASLERGQVVA